MLVIFISLALIILDQVSKLACEAWLATLENGTLVIWDGVFNLSYVKNTGAAWGVLGGATWFLTAVTIVLCALLIWFLIKNYLKLHTLIRIAFALILAGAVGNLIDRVFLGYVRDMFYFVLIDFPVFNVADSAITVGAGILLIDLLFTQKGKALMDDWERRLSKKKPKAMNEEKAGEETNEGSGRA